MSGSRFSLQRSLREGCVRLGEISPEDWLLDSEKPVDPYLARAIMHSWRWTIRQYKRFKPDPDVDYPGWPNGANKRAWPASGVAHPLPVVLPPRELIIEKPIELPSCVSLVGGGGTGAFGGTTLRFRKEGCLRIIGNLEEVRGVGPFQTLRGQISGIKIVPERSEVKPVVYVGDVSNHKFANNHIMNLGNKDQPAITHSWQYEMGRAPRFGKVLVEKSKENLKECDISNNQIEGGVTGIEIHAGFDCLICSNKILYTKLGIFPVNCKETSVQGNRIYGSSEGDAIQVEGQGGIIGSGNGLLVSGNAISRQVHGIVLRAKESMVVNNHFIQVKHYGSGVGVDRMVSDFWRSSEGPIGPMKETDRIPGPEDYRL